MAERNLDFDKIINRRHTNCLKYDFAQKRGMPPDVLPLWVADMDFPTSSYIQDALIRQVQHGIFGYSEVQEKYFEILKAWFLRHYQWEISEKWLVKTPGIVFALAMAVKAFTNPGDGVLIQLPVYYPFREVIEDNQRKVVSNDLVYDENLKYHIDFSDFEEKIKKEKIKLFFLCNPHNPVGRVWTKEELEKIGTICKKYSVIVVSDEIHADFVFKGKHQVFADVREDFSQFTITCTSPSKTFNIAGLQLSNIFIPNPELKKKFVQQLNAAGYSQLNIMGLIAAMAAYQDGEEWYQAVHHYIGENIAYTRQFIEQQMPQVRMAEQEGTYLVWLDFRALQISDEELNDRIVNRAKLWLDSGGIFGESGKGFQRINVACPRKILTQALEQLVDIRNI